MKPCQLVCEEAARHDRAEAAGIVADALECRPDYLKATPLRRLLATCVDDPVQVLGPYASHQLANLPERAARALAAELRSIAA